MPSAKPTLCTWQLVFIAILLVFAINYVVLVFLDRFYKAQPLKGPPVPTRPVANEGTREGFIGNPTQTDSDANKSKYEWLSNEKIYDSFYASIYDQLVQGSKRTQAEIALLLAKWKFGDRKQSELRILDIGAGTGVAAIAFAKEGVGKIVALDNSKAMLEYAEKKNLPASTLTDKQKQSIEWRYGTAIDPSICKPQEFDCAAIMYFSLYYMPDIDGLFRNLSLWIAPGGHIAVQVVNKYKFDPILDSASPFAFSVQKYSKERVSKSKVNFDTFDYEAEFHLDGESDKDAEFRETFRFKDGSVRRQRHTFNMPDIKVIVNKAKAAGWIYQGFIDERDIGFEYSYLLLFTH
jgi:ubiquinone/menaquinone biosynthesis C-methylase UbiE